MTDTAKRSRALPPSLAAAVTGKSNGHAPRRPRSPTATETLTRRKQARHSPSPTPPDDTAPREEHREQEAAPHSKPSSRRQLFAHCTFAILLGVDITAGRRDVWRTQIEKRSGQVVAAVGKDVTHVVVPRDFNGWTAWRDGVRDKYVRRWKVVRAEWMVQTLTKGAHSSDSRSIVSHVAEVQAPPAAASSSDSSASVNASMDSVPASPPLLASCPSDMPPLSPALSQQSTPTPSPIKYLPTPTPSPSLSQQQHLSVPNSDDDGDDTLATHPASSKLPQTEYLIDPTLHDAHSAASTGVQSVMKPHPYFTHNKEKLACQQYSSSLVNHNANITEVLERLEEMNAAVGDKWRAYSYRKAVGIVKQYPRAIRTEADLAEIGRVKGMGGKMVGKVREIIETGTLSKVGHMEGDERMQVMERFTKIHGVGATTAARWYAMGLRTLNDVEQSPHVELNPQQRVGLNFYEDKLRRIPRVEVRAVEEYVREEAQRLLPGVQVICCGSYRRGKPSSGDVDLLITHDCFGDTRAAWRVREDFMVMLMRRLEGNICAPHWWRKKLTEVVSSAEKEGSMEAEAGMVGGGSAGKVAVKDEARCKDEENVKVEAVKDEEPATQPVKTDECKQQPTQPLPFHDANSEGDADTDDVTVTKSSTAADPSSSTAADELPLPPFITGRLQPFERLTMRHAQANFMGFCCLPAGHPQHSGINRRLDIKVYPVSMFPFALLYFTGSDHFNRSMRFYAKRCGWTLSDHGLSPANRAAGDKVWVGSSVVCRTERDVFDAMGLDFVAPHQRNTYQHWDMTEEEVKRMKVEAEAEERKQERSMREGGGEEGEEQPSDAVGGSEPVDGALSDGGESAVSGKSGLEPEDLYER